MNGLRFKVGELAIFVCPSHSTGIGHEGTTVRVAEVGPYRTGQYVQCVGVIASYNFDYVIDWPSGHIGFVRDWQLQKLDPPAEPKTMTVVEEMEV